MKKLEIIRAYELGEIFSFFWECMDTQNDGVCDFSIVYCRLNVSKKGKRRVKHSRSFCVVLHFKANQLLVKEWHRDINLKWRMDPNESVREVQNDVAHTYLSIVLCIIIHHTYDLVIFQTIEGKFLGL